MSTYSFRAIPWARIVPAIGLALILAEVIHRWTMGAWALQAVVVGLLAGSAAWCLDEPAARVVDVAPRSLAWRTAARSWVLLLLAVLWGAAVLHWRDTLFGHADVVLLQGFAGIVIGAGWVTWHRSRGAATPGLAFAAAVIPGALACALIGPFTQRLPIFPYVAAPEGDWRWSLAAWWVAGLVFLLGLIAALADAPWWRIRFLRA